MFSDPVPTIIWSLYKHQSSSGARRRSARACAWAKGALRSTAMERGTGMCSQYSYSCLYGCIAAWREMVNQPFSSVFSLFSPRSSKRTVPGFQTVVAAAFCLSRFLSSAPTGAISSSHVIQSKERDPGSTCTRTMILTRCFAIFASSNLKICMMRETECHDFKANSTLPSRLCVCVCDSQVLFFLNRFFLKRISG